MTSENQEKYSGVNTIANQNVIMRELQSNRDGEITSGSTKYPHSRRVDGESGHRRNISTITHTNPSQFNNQGS